MSSPEELAQEALQLLENAENYEQQKNFAKAIECYSRAAENLKQSGYLAHRIDDIYTRITELDRFLKQQQALNKAQQETQIEQLQEQGFAILDAAAQLEKEGRFEDAVQQYMSAINLLAQSGWTETQLENIKEKVISLAENIDKQRQIQQQRDVQYQQQQGQPSAQRFPATTTQPSFSGAGLSASEQKQAQLRAFEEKKRREEEMQNQAFAHIDNAKMFEKENDYDAAIANYQKAMELLNALGWTQQTENLHVVVQKLKRDKANYQQAQVQAPTIDLAPTPQPESRVKEEFELQEFKLMEIEEQKRKEEETQNRAFSLIDIGKRFQREKRYEEAIRQFEEAIQLLKSIGWDAYIQPIQNFIATIKTQQQKEKEAAEIQKQRENQVQELQNTIQQKQKEQFVDSYQEQELKRQAFEQKRQEQASKEKEFFNLLNEADKILKDGDYDGAISKYQAAIDHLNQMGAGWESYIPSINETITHIKEKKVQLARREAEQSKKQQEQVQTAQKYQQQLSEMIQKEKEGLKSKQITIQQREDEIKYREQKKEQAFKYLDAAQSYIRQNEFEKAIYAYQNAGNIFAEIQWTDELPIIEKAIHDLEERKEKMIKLNQNKLEKQIEQKEQEKKFQAELINQLREEREKIRQREIEIKEREKELQYREKRKDEAFNMLDKAKPVLNAGNFDEAMELYRAASNIFAEIQWKDEVELIQNTIMEIEHKKLEEEHRIALEAQQQREREKQEREFQEQMLKEMEKHRQELHEKQIILREREKELQYRETRKNRAFKLLDQAQKYLKSQNFEKALKIYHDVANIFAQIQWNEEIPKIQSAIKDIEKQQKEKEMMALRMEQEKIQSKAVQDAFVDQIRMQREEKRSEFKQEQDYSQRQQQLTEENRRKENAALALVDAADLLLRQEKFDEAIENYGNAIESLKSLGWTDNYLKPMRESLQSIESRKTQKQEEEIARKREIEKQEQEQAEIQEILAQQMQKEKERMEAKKIELQKKEELAQLMEQRKKEAFQLMDEAESLLNKGEYDESMEIYRNAQLILSEIQFPTDIIKDMILKIEKKKAEEQEKEQQQYQEQVRRQQEELIFKQQTAERMQKEEEKMRAKKIQLQQHEERKKLMERRKNDAFNLLEEAETFLNRGHYQKALEYYQSAELILNEIQFPTDMVKNMILRVKEKQRQQELLKQKDLEEKLKKERKDRAYQQEIAEKLKAEKARMRLKQIQIKKAEELQVQLEKRREEAFTLLDEAENATKRQHYEKALESYRKAEHILNELRFPTKSIREMINRVLNLKKQQDVQEEARLREKLEELEEEKELERIVEQRKHREKEKRMAQKIAIEQREKMIQEQMSAREAAYSLLEEAGKYLKSRNPDHDKAISLYVQARSILSENVGWEPEINNINRLIKDLQQEKAIFLERKRLEEEARLKQQQEYDAFQREMQERKAEVERRKDEARRKYKEFEDKKAEYDTLQKEGLELMDNGKRNAKIYAFAKAYQQFNKAKSIFKKMGWNEQIKYIDMEIRNTQLVEQKKKKEEEEMQRIQQELEEQRKVEEKRREAEDAKMRESIQEVGSLADQVSQLIEEKKKELRLTEEQKRQKLERDAKDYRRNMSGMISIKQEIMQELSSKQQIAQKQKKQLEQEKEKEEMDEIARMIKEAAKKAKK